MGEAFRAVAVIISSYSAPVVAFVHSALPVMKPAPVIVDEVTLKVAPTDALGANCSLTVLDVSVAPETTELHPVGTVRLRASNKTVLVEASWLS
jgi:hypothetical protein